MPEGFFTTYEWAEMLGKSYSHIRRLLRGGVKAGKVETKDFRVRVGRSIRKEVHYRLIGSRLGSPSSARPLIPSFDGR